MFIQSLPAGTIHVNETAVAQVISNAISCVTLFLIQNLN